MVRVVLIVGLVWLLIIACIFVGLGLLSRYNERR